MLEVDGLTTRYGAIAALRDASLSVGANELVGLIGPNGAGKTTLLGSIAGLLRPVAGTVRLDGRDVTGTAPDAMLRSGLALVPEHRRLFANLTIAENLRVGGITMSSSDRADLIDEMVQLFPVLQRKFTTSAGYLSGGEAQQLAIARALMSRPKVLLMDEPSLGLAPALVDFVFDLIGQLREQGRTLLVVEQNASRLLSIADRAYVMRSGEIVLSGSAAELRERHDLFDAFVGGPGAAGGDAHG